MSFQIKYQPGCKFDNSLEKIKNNVEKKFPQLVGSIEYIVYFHSQLDLSDHHRTKVKRDIFKLSMMDCCSSLRSFLWATMMSMYFLEIDLVLCCFYRIYMLPLKKCWLMMKNNDSSLSLFCIFFYVYSYHGNELIVCFVLHSNKLIM